MANGFSISQFIFVTGVVVATAGCMTRRQPPPSLEQDRVGIELLHQCDIDAMLSDKADQLVELWDSNAVRLSAGKPTEVGRTTIYANDKRWEASNTGERSLSYTPDIKDLQIAGDWAFEWSYFDATSIEPGHAAPVTVHGKQLRIMKRQADGTWRFARVMSMVDKVDPEIKK